MVNTKGIIAAGHQSTAEVAIEILRDGGNAFDAAIAALLVSFNSEPCMSSPGGGGFANIHTTGGKDEILDFFCQTPKRKRSPNQCDFFPFNINFGGASEEFYIGHGSHAVPGVMAGIFELHRKYGSVPMDVLAQPAIAIAKNGVELDPFQHLDIVLLENMMDTSLQSKELYYPNGKALGIGEVLYLPELADFIFSMSKEGIREFYEGEIAQKVAAASEEKLGHISLEDFKDYKVNFLEPTKVNYKGNLVHTTALPSLGGLVVAMGLGELSQSIIKTEDYQSPEHVKRLLPVLDKMENTTRRPDNLFKHLDMYENIMFSRKWGSTTHFGIMDKDGNAISVTVSNGEGSGYMIPGTSCFMNNMLGEAALLPEGFYSWKEDQRLFSLMSPTIVLNGNQEVKAITGTGGAGRIPGAILQVLHYMMDYGLGAKEAVHAPRMHLMENLLNMEPGFGEGVDFGKFETKIWDDAHMYFGGVHTIVDDGERISGVGDSRRYGVCLEL